MMRKQISVTDFSRAALAVGLGLLLGACGQAFADSQDTSTTAPPQATDSTTTMPPSPTTTAPPVEVPGVTPIPDLSGLTLADARDSLNEAGLEVLALPAAIGSAIVVAQEPAPGIEVKEGTVVTVDVRVVPTCNPPDPVAPGAGQVILTVLYECDTDAIAPTEGRGVARIVPAEDGTAINRIEWTLRSLLAGPTDDEQAAGFGSFFDGGSADALNSVTLTDGHLVADFNDAIIVNNMSTSTGSIFFNAELQRNVFLQPEVDSVEFRFNGDCEAWSGLFESGGCWAISRADWNQALEAWDELREQ